MARTTDYTAEIGRAICDLVSERVSLKRICAKPGFPSVATVYAWRRSHPEFDEAYELARRLRADARQDYVDTVVDEVRLGALSTQAAAVIIKAEQWAMARENPMRYGDKVALAGDAEDGVIRIKMVV